MHLPMLHISSRRFRETVDEDPLKLGKVEGRDIIPWFADPKSARRRSRKRTKSLNIISLILAAVGSEVTYFALLSSLFSAVSRQKALTVAGTIIPSVAVNQFAKARFRFRRPPQDAMHPYAFVAAGDYTFPSGHAQNAMAVGFLFASRAKKLWVKILAAVFGISVPLSRVYLGVHYPRDVIAGSALGLGSVALVNKMEGPFIQWWERSPRGPRGFVVAISSAIIALLSGTPLAAFPMGVAGGLAVGHDLSGHYRFKVDQPKGLVRWVQAIFGAITFMGTGVLTRPFLKKETTATSGLAGGMVGVSLTLGVPIVTSIIHRLKFVRKRLKNRLK